MQLLLAWVFGLLTNYLSPFHQIFICKSTIFPQLHQFWVSFSSEIAQDSFYIANIRDIRLRLPKLQDKDKEAKALRAAGLPENWKDVERVLQYQGLPYIPEIICFKVINCHYNDLFTGYFKINKTQKLVTRRYY